MLPTKEIRIRALGDKYAWFSDAPKTAGATKEARPNARRTTPQDGLTRPSIALFAAVPAGALILQGLYAQKLLLLVLVLKRIYIYTMAGFVVAIGGACGGGDPAALGTRLEELTRELLPEATAEDLKPIQKLDAVPETQQAAAVPAAVAASLLLSLGLLTWHRPTAAPYEMRRFRNVAGGSRPLGRLCIHAGRGATRAATVARRGAVAFAYLVPAARVAGTNVLCVPRHRDRGRCTSLSALCAAARRSSRMMSYRSRQRYLWRALQLCASPWPSRVRLTEGFQPASSGRLGGESRCLGLGDAVFPAL